MKFRDMIANLMAETMRKFPRETEDEFQERFIRMPRFCCYEECMSMAGLSQKAWRANFMPEKAIQVLPVQGCQSRAVQSFIAVAFLSFQSKMLGIPIKHAGGPGSLCCEERVFLSSTANFHRADGYFNDPETGKETIWCINGQFSINFK